MIQESNVSSNSKTPSIQNFTTVRKDHRKGLGDGLLILIQKSINFSRRPEPSKTLSEPLLEEFTITAKMGIYLNTGRLQCIPLGMVRYSSSTDMKGTILDNMISGSIFGILS